MCPYVYSWKGKHSDKKSDYVDVSYKEEDELKQLKTSKEDIELEEIQISEVEVVNDKIPTFMDAVVHPADVSFSMPQNN